MIHDYQTICKRYGVHSLCDLANELERRGFPRPETFQARQVWYNTGGTRVEVVKFRGGLAAEYYMNDGRFWQRKMIKNAPGAFAVYLPTVNEIKTWEILKDGQLIK